MELSFPEILLILAIALIVLGPQDLIKYSQQLGKWIGKLKTQLNNVHVMLNEEILMEEKRKLEEALTIKDPTLKTEAKTEAEKKDE